MMEPVALYIAALANAIDDLERRGYTRGEIRDALDDISTAVFMGFRPSAEELIGQFMRKEVR